MDADVLRTLFRHLCGLLPVPPTTKGSSRKQQAKSSKQGFNTEYAFSPSHFDAELLTRALVSAQPHLSTWAAYLQMEMELLSTRPSRLVNQATQATHLKGSLQALCAVHHHLMGMLDSMPRQVG
jgi:hypothetical protein